MGSNTNTPTSSLQLSSFPEDKRHQRFGNRNCKDIPGHSALFTDNENDCEPRKSPVDKNLHSTTRNSNNYCKEVNSSDFLYMHHRTTSIHRNTTACDYKESTQFRTFPRILEDRRNWVTSAGIKIRQTSLEQRASNIANRMQLDGVLMEDSPESEQLRKEALKDMPQCLTIKRLIKRKIYTSINQRPARRSLRFYTKLKYYFSLKTSETKNSLKSLAYSFELWYSSLKTIEGHFGSGVATFFKFFRCIFIMNCLITGLVIGFIVIPQLLYVHVNYSNVAFNLSFVSSEGLCNSFRIFSSSLQNNVSFKAADIFTGEGYFTNTSLYYGFYANTTIVLAESQKYFMPYAYFFTMLSIYVASFVFLSVSMARSYRRSFIETQGGLKNIYAHKIFCGWDFSIATQEAADLKSSSIYFELKELLNDTLKTSEDASCMQIFRTRSIQIAVNISCAFILIGVGNLIWFLLAKSTDTSLSVVTAIVINIIILVLPPFFSYIVKYESYRHPSAAFYITLIRTFLLMLVVIGVFLSFWLIYSDKKTCWETSIGQHIYRLILFDFLFYVLGIALVEAVRYFIFKKWNKISSSDFNVAKYTMNLIYNQTLFWTGLYFSPLLTVVVVLKMWCTWYARRTCLLQFCKPSVHLWRAAQTHTWFLILSFMSLLLVIIVHGYIIVDVATSDCGPFRNYNYMYEMVLKGIFQLEQNNFFWKVIMFIFKPGTIALILVAMCVTIYYLRAKTFAQKGMVQILRNMLVLEAKDKEFLLETISKVTEGQWQYNLQRQVKYSVKSSDDVDMPHGQLAPQSFYGYGGEFCLSDTSSTSDVVHDNATLSSDTLFLPKATSLNFRKKK